MVVEVKNLNKENYNTYFFMRIKLKVWTMMTFFPSISSILIYINNYFYPFSTIKKQLALEIARRRAQLDLDEDLANIANGTLLNEFYLKLAKDLDVLEPKDPESIYKSHLEDKKYNTQIDSAKENLAATIVNGFVNAGCGKDSLMMSKDNKEGPWYNKLKTDGQISASASLGLTFLWDFGGGADQLSDYLDIKDGYLKMGACIGIGLYNSGVSSDVDPAKALLED